MTTSGNRRLFLKVHTATVYSMALGAGVFAAQEPLTSTLGSFAGTVTWVGLFLGVSLLVSMVEFGGLLRHNETPHSATPSDQPA